MPYTVRTPGLPPVATNITCLDEAIRIRHEVERTTYRAAFIYDSAGKRL